MEIREILRFTGLDADDDFPPTLVAQREDSLRFVKGLNANDSRPL